MPAPLVDSFQGYLLDVANPPFNSAKGGQNFVIHRRRNPTKLIEGFIEQGDGYAKKTFVTGGSNPGTLPANDSVIRKISEFSCKDIYNLYIPDHGGQNVTVVAGTYTKTGYFLQAITGTGWSVDGGSLTKVTGTGTAFLSELRVGDPVMFNSTPKIVDSITNNTQLYVTVAFGGAASGTTLKGPPRVWRFGIWIRPYWSGSAWIDEWTELTEMFIFDLDALGINYPWLPETDWTSTNWTGSFAAGWLHTVGYTTPLSQAKSAEIDIDYTVTWTVTERTAGTFILTFGGGSQDDLSASGSMKFRATATGNLIITPSSNFDGRIVIAIEETYDDKIYLDDASASKYAFPTIDPTGQVFTTDHFKDWTLVYTSFGDDENYDLIRSSGFDGDRYYLQLIHPNTDFSSRTAPTKLMVYRCFLLSELPSTLSDFIYGVLSEARLTSGNNIYDVSLMVGSRTKSFAATHGGVLSPTYTRNVDAIVADIACPYVWPYAVVLGIRIDAAATDPPDPQTYYLKYSLVLDDGTETRLYDAFTEAGSPGSEFSTLNAGNSLTLSAGQGIKINGLYSFGTLPVRSKFLRIYMSDDGEQFFRTLDLDLTLTATWAQAYTLLIPVQLPGVKHFFAVSCDIEITKAIWPSPGEIEATAQIGRAMTDDGVIQYKAAAVVGNITYAIGVRKNGILYPNHIFASLQNGDGAPQFDAFGLVSLNMINLEYNDGDELVGAYPSHDTLLAFKRRSLVQVSQSISGKELVFIRTVVTKSDGICSIRTLADFEDVVYWAGYNGIYCFSSSGVQLLNRAWLNEWKAVAQADKEAAVSTFDRLNRQYRIAYAGIERLLDIDTGQWDLSDLANQPERFATDQRAGTVDFLSGVYIQTLGAGTLHDGAAFTLDYVTNDFLASESQITDALLLDVRIKYSSDVALVVTLYRDGVAQSPVALAAGNGSSTIPAGLSFRCKNFGIEIQATFTSSNQALEIKEICPRYQIVLAGLTRPAFASEGAGAGIEQRPMAVADIRSGRQDLIASALTTVSYSRPFSNTVGTNYSLKVDVYNNADEWIMSVEGTNLTKYGFDVISPENGYASYIAAAHQ